jgi:hypothetical protein
MNVKFPAIFIIGFISLLLPFTAQAQTNEYFDIDLTGYEGHVFGSFNQLGYEITPLAQLYFRIVEQEQEWIGEPRLYTKGNKGYLHLLKKDGTNVLYQVEKQTSGELKGMWEVVDVKRKKINRIPVPKPLLQEVLISRLLDPISTVVDRPWYRGNEKILKIEKDEHTMTYYVTVQVITFEGAHNPPYGEETITFRVKGSEVEVLDYKHRDIPKEELGKLKLR